MKTSLLPAAFHPEQSYWHHVLHPLCFTEIQGQGARVPVTGSLKSPVGSPLTQLRRGFNRLHLATWATSSQVLQVSHTLTVGFTGSQIKGLKKHTQKKSISKGSCNLSYS